MLAVVAVTGLSPKPLVLMTTGCFVLVYALGAAAAVKLLPRRTWARRAALVSLVAVAGLFVSTGRYLIWALIVAVAALAYSAKSEALRRSRVAVPDP
jgi:amino acid efflux transporter